MSNTFPTAASARPGSGDGDLPKPTLRLARPPTTRPRAEGELEARLESHRAQLWAHCRRMLGSSSEADDAVQDTLVRAWRTVDRFEGRATLRTWLYRIATNVCLDMRHAPQRRARPLADARTEHTPAPAQHSPAEVVAERDAVRQAFVVALTRLPPRQRTVLVLREVFGWRATEVADLLDTSVVSVNSALQRARARLRDREHLARFPQPDTDHVRPDLLTSCVAAFDHYDVETLTSLLHHDHHADHELGTAPAA